VFNTLFPPLPKKNAVVTIWRLNVGPPAFLKESTPPLTSLKRTTLQKKIMVTTRGNTYEEEEIETERPADMITEVTNSSTPGTHSSDTPPSSTTSEISALVNLLRSHGWEHEDPATFLNHVVGNAAPETHLNRATAQLRNEAALWWQAQRQLLPSYDDFKIAFLHRYDGEDRRNQLLASFYGQRQRNDEKAEDFLRKKRLLARRLAPEMEEKALVRFCSGMLQPELVVSIGIVHPTTMDDFIYGVCRMEDQLEKCRKTSQNNTKRFLPKCRFCPETHYHADCPVLKQRNT
jgi:hypothetical protein